MRLPPLYRLRGTEGRADSGGTQVMNVAARRELGAAEGQPLRALNAEPGISLKEAISRCDKKTFLEPLFFSVLCG